MGSRTLNRRQAVAGGIALIAGARLPAVAAAREVDASGQAWNTLYDFDITWNGDWALHDWGNHSLPDVGMENIALGMGVGISVFIELSPSNPVVANDPLAYLEDDFLAGLPPRAYSVVAKGEENDGAWMVRAMYGGQPSITYAEVRVPVRDEDPVIMVQLDVYINGLDVDWVEEGIDGVQIGDDGIFEIGDSEDVMNMMRDILKKL